jgi:hypothetical protein
MRCELGHVSLCTSEPQPNRLGSELHPPTAFACRHTIEDVDVYFVYGQFNDAVSDF